MKVMRKLKFWSRTKKPNKKNSKFVSTESSSPPPPPPPSRPAPSSPPSPPPPSRPPPPPPRPYRHNPGVHSQYLYEPLLPSAPPLPPWLEFDDLQFQEAQISTSSSSSLLQYHSKSKSQTTMMNITTPSSETKSPDDDGICTDQESQVNSKSYKQYHMVPYPIYETPKAVNVPRLENLERRGGGGGAFMSVVFSFGAHLLRCVFPCFHIRPDVLPS